MTPDVVASLKPAQGDGRERLIVLDAKYRIDEGLNEALNSIHTYRDALVREVQTGTIEGVVSAAYLLSPAIPTLNGSYRETTLPGRLFHPEYRVAFRFGALTLRPGMSIEDLRGALRLIINDVRPAST